MKGVVPLGDFWIMKKLKGGMLEEDLKKIPSRKETINASLTVWRLRSNDVIFRSAELVKSVQTIMKGDNMDRDFHRNIMWLYHMTKGDAFIDFLEFRNQKIKDRKAKALGKKNAKSDENDDDGGAKKIVENEIVGKKV